MATDIVLQIGPTEMGKATILVNRAISEVIGKEVSGDASETTLDELDIDSLTMVEASMAIEEALGIKIDESYMERLSEKKPDDGPDKKPNIGIIYGIVRDVLNDYASQGLTKGAVVGSN